MDDASPPLTIGTFARRSRLSPKALRLYDRLGVLTPARVDEHNGYRLYAEEQLTTARLVGLLRRLQMPLKQIADVVSAAEGQRAQLVADYWREAEERFAEQRELVNHLTTRLTGDSRALDRFAVEHRHVPEQLVLTSLRSTTVIGLSPWLGQTLSRLTAEAAAIGRDGGPAFVIFHGEVSEDSDGPVEVCVPIVTGAAGSAGTRVEPAHDEAFTRITVAQVSYPAILSAYDAVERWISDRGLEQAGSPREVYVDGFDGLAPHEVGCLIAFPIVATSAGTNAGRPASA